MNNRFSKAKEKEGNERVKEPKNAQQQANIGSPQYYPVANRITNALSFPSHYHSTYSTYSTHLRTTHKHTLPPIHANSGDRPSLWDPLGQAKYDAWAELSNSNSERGNNGVAITSKEEAMRAYVNLVQSLIGEDVPLPLSPGV